MEIKELGGPFGQLTQGQQTNKKLIFTILIVLASSYEGWSTNTKFIFVKLALIYFGKVLSKSSSYFEIKNLWWR